MRSLFTKRETPFVYNKYYLSAQDKWAKKMKSITTGLSKRTLIYLLILFVVLTTGFFVVNIYEAFSKIDLNSEIKTIKSSKNHFSKINTINLKVEDHGTKNTIP